MNTDQFEYLTIEPASQPCAPNEVSVKGYKRCERGVMKGQMLSHFIDRFPSPEDAAEAYPEADPANEYTTPQPSFNHLPDDNDPPVGEAGQVKPNGEYRGN